MNRNVIQGGTELMDLSTQVLEWGIQPVMELRTHQNTTFNYAHSLWHHNLPPSRSSVSVPLKSLGTPIESAFAFSCEKELRISEYNFLTGMPGEANDAVSAHTQVHMLEAPRLLRLPGEERPQVWLRPPPSRRSTQWNPM